MNRIHQILHLYNDTNCTRYFYDLQFILHQFWSIRTSNGIWLNNTRVWHGRLWRNIYYWLFKNSVCVFDKYSNDWLLNKDTEKVYANTKNSEIHSIRVFEKQNWLWWHRSYSYLNKRYYWDVFCKGSKNLHFCDSKLRSAPRAVVVDFFERFSEFLSRISSWKQFHYWFLGFSGSFLLVCGTTLPASTSNTCRIFPTSRR